MKKFPKIVQADKRGQIVIPKEVREELGIDHTTGFYVYSISDEGILLKKVEPEPLDEDNELIKEIKSKADKIKVNPKNVDKAVRDYKKDKEGGLELI